MEAKGGQFTSIKSLTFISTCTTSLHVEHPFTNRLSNSECNSSRISILQSKRTTTRYRYRSRSRYRCSVESPKPKDEQSNKFRINTIPLSVLTLYLSRLFIFPPHQLHPISKDIPEAISLSLNFFYILPIILPHYAPSFPPTLESIFHITVFWALLTVGFSSIDLFKSSDKSIKATPFLLSSLLLTNIFYLPYLVLRNPHPIIKSEQQQVQVLPIEKKSQLVQFSESKLLPYLSLGFALFSIPWAFLARPQYGFVGDISMRIQQFYQLAVNDDILAFSFAIDCLVYVFFQAALVEEDAHFRSWSSDQIKNRAVAVAKFIPFFGLAFYLLQRAEHAPLQWTQPDEKTDAE